jgi:phospho-N-acetylmuramoyl-pentapeptide-transferase
VLYYLHLLPGRLAERFGAAPEWMGPLRLFESITFRAAAAAITALALSLLLGPAFVRRLKAGRAHQPQRSGRHFEELEKTTQSKKETPTFGGVLIVGTLLTTTLLWARWDIRYVWTALAVTVALATLGFADDYSKVRRSHSGGVRARTKMLAQIAIGVAAGFILLGWDTGGDVTYSELMLPFLKRPVIDMGWMALLFFGFILVGSSNAANLTDGLDGLAIGTAITASLAYAALSYVAGNFRLADYLLVPYVPGAGELTVFCSALLGAGLGFLWFNAAPAEVFMGDTGSLALGGAVGIVAILIRQELTLPIVGGVFVLEAGSVILQVASFKSTGRRVFRMAPLHHHFVLGGVPETKVVIRFWILSIMFALLGIGTLKLR